MTDSADGKPRKDMPPEEGAGGMTVPEGMDALVHVVPSSIPPDTFDEKKAPIIHLDGQRLDETATLPAPPRGKPPAGDPDIPKPPSTPRIPVGLPPKLSAATMGTLPSMKAVDPRAGPASPGPPSSGKVPVALPTSSGRMPVANPASSQKIPVAKAATVPNLTSTARMQAVKPPVPKPSSLPKMAAVRVPSAPRMAAVRPPSVSKMAAVTPPVAGPPPSEEARAPETTPEEPQTPLRAAPPSVEELPKLGPELPAFPSFERTLVLDYRQDSAEPLPPEGAPQEARNVAESKAAAGVPERDAAIEGHHAASEPPPSSDTDRRIDHTLRMENAPPVAGSAAAEAIAPAPPVMPVSSTPPSASARPPPLASAPPPPTRGLGRAVFLALMAFLGVAIAHGLGFLPSPSASVESVKPSGWLRTVPAVGQFFPPRATATAVAARTEGAPSPSAAEASAASSGASALSGSAEPSALPSAGEAAPSALVTNAEDPPSPSVPTPKGDPSAAPNAGPAEGTGLVRTTNCAPGRRIFVDGKTLGQTPQSVTVKCGSRAVKIGSSGRVRTIDVPCGGEITVNDP